jgi:hypothetical protein
LNPTTSEIISTGTIGAAHELLVAADLMFRGFAVFRAMSPACVCDLAIITPDRRLYRIEVTTGYYQPNGSITHSKKAAQQRGTFDILAVVIKTNRSIVYEPLLETLNGGRQAF